MKKILLWLSYVVLFGIAVALVRCTMAQGTDFWVFWNAGRNFLAGKGLYGLVSDQSAGMVFKYPPWDVLLFVPFSFFTFEKTAKIVWGLVQVLSLASVLRSIYRLAGVKWVTLFVMTLLYWGIWIVHALDGQIALTMMALALLSLEFSSPILEVFTLYVVSAKIFTVFPWILNWRSKLNRKVLLMTAGAVILGTVLVTFQTANGSLGKIFHDWSVAAQSGATLLPDDAGHGRRNPSLSMFVSKTIGISPLDSRSEIFVSLIFFILGAWAILRIAPQQMWRWAFALAWTPIAHPLSWFHLFSWTFPLAVMGVNEWMKKRDWKTGVVGGFGIALITLSSLPFLGPVMEWLEWHAAKGWGTLLLCLAVEKLLKQR